MKVFDIDHKFQNIMILGTGWALPPLSFTNEEMVAWHGHKDPDWIFERIGIRSRYALFDYNNNKPSDLDEDDLTLQASKDALEEAEMTIQEIDTIFFATSTPTHQIFPDPACQLHGRLGASMDTPAITLTSGCCGTLNGLMLALSMIRAGQARNVLVAGASSMSSYFRPHLKEKVWLHSCIFGDGAASLVIGKRKGNSRPYQGFGSFFLGSDSTVDVANKQYGGSKRPPEPDNMEDVLNDFLDINFRAVPDNINLKLNYVYKNLMSLTDITPSKVDWILLNQANAVYQQKWIMETGFRLEKAYSNMEYMGNCAAASLGLTLHDFIHTVKPEKGTLAMVMALGTGLQYGGALYRF